MKIKFPENQLLASLPPKVELAIFLIKEELKNVKFINDLQATGTDASIGLLDLSPLISAIIGFKNNLTDEFREWYFDRQTELVASTDVQNDKELLEQAFNFYVDLVVKSHEWDIECKP
ncbi:MAG: hypothetical protein MI921_13025 [Cytophagales bacterium]|nr:hypothetical protein [Cytophagales bacterium]